MIFRLHEEVRFERKRRVQESCDSLAVFDVPRPADQSSLREFFPYRLIDHAAQMISTSEGTTSSRSDAPASERTTALSDVQHLLSVPTGDRGNERASLPVRLTMHGE